MNVSQSLVRFEWAMNRWLYNEEGYVIFEGLISCVLNKNIHIRKLLDCLEEDPFERNKRVDILAEDDNGELFLIEVQNETEFAYFQRMLFGTSKLVTEYINRGQGYENIRKIYSINIVYFRLGNGTDYVYHGKTEFRGIHNNELLTLSNFQQQKFAVSEVSELYPEYYILKVNDFNKWSKVPLEQWIYFLSTGEIPDEADAPGLDEARTKLKLDSMTKSELEAYYRHLDNIVILQDNITTARGEGRLEGHAEGRAEAFIDVARTMKQQGFDTESIMKCTNLSIEAIQAL